MGAVWLHLVSRPSLIRLGSQLTPRKYAATSPAAADKCWQGHSAGSRLKLSTNLREVSQCPKKADFSIILLINYQTCCLIKQAEGFDIIMALILRQKYPLYGLKTLINVGLEWWLGISGLLNKRPWSLGHGVNTIARWAPKYSAVSRTCWSRKWSFLFWPLFPLDTLLFK